MVSTEVSRFELRLLQRLLEDPGLPQRFRDLLVQSGYLDDLLRRHRQSLVSGLQTYCAR